MPSRVIVTPAIPCSPKSTWPSSLKSAKTMPERLDGARATPLTVNVSPIAETGLAARVVDQLAGAVDVDDVAARVGGGAEVDGAAGDPGSRPGRSRSIPGSCCCGRPACRR